MHMCLMIWSRFKDDGMKGLGLRARICVLMALCDVFVYPANGEKIPPSWRAVCNDPDHSVDEIM